jgi:hypothetical protein
MEVNALQKRAIANTVPMTIQIGNQRANDSRVVLTLGAPFATSEGLAIPQFD